MSIRSPSSSHAAERGSRVQARRHIRALMGKTLAYFADHESDNLTLVREHLLDLVDARPSQARGQNLRSACLLLHKHADVFNRAFQAALQTSLEEEVRSILPDVTDATQSRNSASDEALNGMTLSLIDVCEVERILLLDRVAQRFTAHYDASVSPLTLRLGALLGQDAPSLLSNPFRPEVFVRAFLLAWEKSGLDDQATEDLLLALEPRHSLDLAPLYADLNATLMQAGIEAQTMHRIKRSDSVPSAHANLGPASAAAPLSGGDEAPVSRRPGLGAPEAGRARSVWGGLAPAGRNIAAQARQFLQRLGLGSPPAPGDSGDGEALAWTETHGDGARQTFAPADPEFMGYLGDLQAGAGASSSYQILEGQDPGDHNILRQMRDRDEVRRAPELDRGTVDALAEVFDFVFADQAIPLQMKFVIGRLQIPVLKAAMIDRDFFLSADHPARRLVDTLASASVAWAPEKGENDPLYVRIESTVKRVLTEFEDDLTLFSELLLEFTEFLFETEQQAQVRIEPAADHERVGESYEQALAHADEAVHDRIKALPPELPLAPFLAPFLTTQWREVMARAWLNVTDSPAQWDSALTAMDQLIWSTQPKTRTEERRRLVAVLPDLVRNLNAGLDAIDWTGEARATFTRRLISTHMLAIRMTQPVAVDTASALLEANAGQEAMNELDQRRAGKLAGSADEFDAMAQTFSRGLWFDFMVNETTRHRCRLSWVSPMRTRLLFTNRDGFDAFVRSEREVAALLRRGRLSVIDQVPIVSRALDQIMSDAQDRQAA
ncbi:MAG: DUF1631 domain-containing protein [Rhodoferax sp.]|uniref:DUF1631 domain-containing protein n=1 Tax=Rhodoferax sp. TaxID=50421 RepID=UPI00271E86B0|nr:DUF1631 domain-containing protein [Rhodoferax sp.]MDO8448512.1 DUF1631 domain-containing protein [Rhodoferax sp.]